MDIDNSSFSRVEKEVKKIQKSEKWGNAYILNSSKKNHWHIYFFNDSVSWKKIIKVINKCPIVDKKFKEFKEKFPFIRARLSNLPKQEIITVESEHNNVSMVGNFYHNHLMSCIKTFKEYPLL